jgi:hypothetical protein
VVPAEAAKPDPISELNDQVKALWDIVKAAHDRIDALEKPVPEKKTGKKGE